MRFIVPVLFASLLLGVRPAGAQEATSPTRKQAQAVRVQGRSPVVDGRLDDAVWASAPIISDFVQKNPEEGIPPSDRTEVRFVYSDDALYVGARMFAKDPASVQAPVSRRDNSSQAEYLIVSLDTYLDRRTAYTFGVTASGVRLDWYHPSDDEEEIYKAFDPVWEARTRVDSTGWTAEMRIPYSQLRFNARPEEVWGVNVARWVPSRNEQDVWVLIPRNTQAWASRFGDLRGVMGIRPTRRLELIPYVAGTADYNGNPGVGNPFDHSQAYAVHGGGEVKMGVGPNTTIEATVNPDFGQVEADAADVNLSAFETVFPEKRPFFVEGSQLLQGYGPTYFYSRRIGAPSINPDLVDGDYTDFPTSSTILGAGKVTGRSAMGTSYGVLAALTDGEEARTFDVEDGRVNHIAVAPQTMYGVGRVQQQFGGGSTVGFGMTGVRRDLQQGTLLASLLHDQAYTGGLDWDIRFRDGEYVLAGWAGYSYVHGDSAALLNTQLSSARYFQRPDVDYVTLDPSRTSLSGYSAALTMSRNSGRHWLWSVGGGARSPGFELNDVGQLSTADDLGASANIRYRETQARGLLRNWRLGLSTEQEWNFGGDHGYSTLRTDAQATWKNFWRTVASGWVDFRGQSDNLTRGGPLMGTGRGWGAIVQLLGNAASRRQWNGRIYYSESELGEQTYRLSGGLSLRPAPRWQLSVTPNYLRTTNPRQYIATLEGLGGPEETGGNRYVFSFIDRSTLLTQFRLNYSFTPDLSLEAYGEPFAASGRYRRFGELPRPGSRDLRFFTPEEIEALGGEPDLDFNIRSFRSSAVMRWEWRPGSTLFVVWQQNRYAQDSNGNFVGPGSLLESLDASGRNVLMLKFSRWISVK